MKKFKFHLILVILSMFILSSCNQNSSSTITPKETTEQFLQSLQKQDYQGAKAYYEATFENMANFRNQIETLSPQIANELFNKLADFTYTINNTSIDSADSNKAYVNITITSYDLGKAFEKMLLDYTKTDLSMTFDGAKDEDITKEAEKLITDQIKNTTSTFSTTTDIELSKESDTWKIVKISNNPVLLNALSGNIISTIDTLSTQLEENIS